MSNTVKRALLEGNKKRKHATQALAAQQLTEEFMMRIHRTYVVNLHEVNIAWKTN